MREIIRAFANSRAICEPRRVLWEQMGLPLGVDEGPQRGKAPFGSGLDPLLSGLDSLRGSSGSLSGLLDFRVRGLCARLGLAAGRCAQLGLVWGLCGRLGLSGRLVILIELNKCRLASWPRCVLE